MTRLDSNLQPKQKQKQTKPAVPVPLPPSPSPSPQKRRKCASTANPSSSLLDENKNEYLPGPEAADEGVALGSLDFHEILDEDVLKHKSTVVNRAPVMMAWSCVVAERLGFMREEAVCLLTSASFIPSAFAPPKILAFNDALPDFARINTTVLGTSLLHVWYRAAFPNHAQNAAISTDLEYSHHAQSQQPCDAGGLGPNLCIPLLADHNMNVACKYGCRIED